MFPPGMAMPPCGAVLGSNVRIPLRRPDLNWRSLEYESSEIPDFSTPRCPGAGNGFAV
jgi:hypothetical protein